MMSTQISTTDWYSHKQDFDFLQILVQPGNYTLCRLPAAAPLPPSIAELLTNPVGSNFCNSLTRCENETSVVLTTESPEASTTLKNKLREEVANKEGFDVDGDWKCLRVRGPMKFDLVGVMSQISQALARESISLFCISTWDTDYILVKKLEESIQALKHDGWTVLE